MIDKLDLNTKAQEIRERLGEDVNSPVDIFSIVNQIEGLTIVLYPMGDNISGMCIKDKDVRLIAINSMMSYGRQRFSLAHELYHLFYDEELEFNVCSQKFNTNNDNERKADQFASFFLAPYKSLKTQIEKIVKDDDITIENLIELEQYFGMSHLAMFHRLVSEGYLDIEQLDNYSCGVKKIAKSLGYSDQLYNPSNINNQKMTYGYYLKQVEELRKKDLVSNGKVEGLLLNAFRADIVFGLEDEDMEGDMID